MLLLIHVLLLLPLALALEINLVSFKDDIAPRQQEAHQTNHPPLSILQDQLDQPIGDIQKVFKEYEKQWTWTTLHSQQLSNHEHMKNIQEWCSWIEARRMGMMGGLSEHVYHLMNSLSTQFDVPYITWDWNFHEGVLNKQMPDSSECRIFSLRPDLTEPLQEHLLKDKWNRFAYIYSLDRNLGQKPERKVVIDLGAHQIGSNKTSFSRHVQLFSWLAHLGMIRAEYHYLLVDFHLFDLPLSNIKHSGVKISGFHLLNHTKIAPFTRKWNMERFGFDLHSLALISDTFLVMEKISLELHKSYITENSISCYKKNLEFDTSNKTKWNLGQKIVEFLQDKEITSDLTGLIRFDSRTCKRRGHVLFLSQFSEASAAPERIAWWSPESGLGWQDYNSKQAKSNVNEEQEVRKSLRVVTIKSMPFAMPIETGDGKKELRGYCVDLAKRIFHRLNLSYEMHLVHDDNYGKLMADGKSWNGIIGMIQKSHAAIRVEASLKSCLGEPRQPMRRN
ncbi:Glutamate receptor ionotropic, kainate 1 [Cichlidogyrus casuarinus]|uniref:Glutamate receptor ionotropic, kainate 1 n=1 Tax=Cichlidogyrus casuarinus TaxID=1844966 RepID=A0ABD2Q991_9PLAT